MAGYWQLAIGFAWRNGIKTAGMKGMAFANPFGAEHDAPHGAVPKNRNASVFRAAGIKAATTAKPPGEAQLINADYAR